MSGARFQYPPSSQGTQSFAQRAASFVAELTHSLLHADSLAA